MTTRTKLTTKGLEAYLEKVADAGAKIDPAADRALVAGGAVLAEGMEERAPKLSGELASKIKATEPAQDGNFHYIEVGVITDDAEVARYGNVQEFGSSTNAAQPYVRPTLDGDMTKARGEMRKSLKKDALL